MVHHTALHGTPYSTAWYSTQLLFAIRSPWFEPCSHLIQDFVVRAVKIEQIGSDIQKIDKE
jgi:hypothetical protein